MSADPLDAAAGERAERIAKVLARAGVCSRRDAERWVADGRVSVDGRVLTTPAITVTAVNDIRVDGKPLPTPERPRLWRYHKPAGLVTSHRDEKGRPTVFDALPKDLPRLISVGRLDLNSEGLLLLTNDGVLARRLELPSTGGATRCASMARSSRIALPRSKKVSRSTVYPTARSARASNANRVATPGLRWHCAKGKTVRFAGCSSISGFKSPG